MKVSSIVKNSAASVRPPSVVVSSVHLGRVGRCDFRMDLGCQMNSIGTTDRYALSGETSIECSGLVMI